MTDTERRRSADGEGTGMSRETTLLELPWDLRIMQWSYMRIIKPLLFRYMDAERSTNLVLITMSVLEWLSYPFDLFNVWREATIERLEAKLAQKEGK